MKKNEIKILSREEFKKFTKQINEGSNPNAKRQFGCIMISHNKLNFHDEIDPNDVYDNDEGKYGIETEPHITVCYGLHDDELDKDEVIMLLKSLIIPTVLATEISLFENEKFDVLKYDITSKELSLMNKIISSIFPYTTDYPDYHAHSTIAYLKPGTGKKYVKKIDEKEVKPTHWVYSQANGEKLKIESDSVEILRKKDEQA